MPPIPVSRIMSHTNKPPSLNSDVVYLTQTRSTGTPALHLGYACIPHEYHNKWQLMQNVKEEYHSHKYKSLLM